MIFHFWTYTFPVEWRKRNFANFSPLKNRGKSFSERIFGQEVKCHIKHERGCTLSPTPFRSRVRQKYSESRVGSKKQFITHKFIIYSDVILVCAVCLPSSATAVYCLYFHNASSGVFDFFIIVRLCLLFYFHNRYRWFVLRALCVSPCVLRFSSSQSIGGVFAARTHIEWKMPHNDPNNSNWRHITLTKRTSQKQNKKKISA